MRYGRRGIQGRQGTYGIHGTQVTPGKKGENARDSHADADRMPIRNMRRIYRAISNKCRILRICASANISAWPSLVKSICHLCILQGHPLPAPHPANLDFSALFTFQSLHILLFIEHPPCVDIRETTTNYENTIRGGGLLDIGKACAVLVLTCMTNIPSSRRKSKCSSLCCNIFSRWVET